MAYNVYSYNGEPYNGYHGEPYMAIMGSPATMATYTIGSTDSYYNGEHNRGVPLNEVFSYNSDPVPSSMYQEELPNQKITMTFRLNSDRKISNALYNNLNENNMDLSEDFKNNDHLIDVLGYPPSHDFTEATVLQIVRKYYSSAVQV